MKELLVAYVCYFDDIFSEWGLCFTYKQIHLVQPALTQSCQPEWTSCHVRYLQKVQHEQKQGFPIKGKCKI